MTITQEFKRIDGNNCDNRCQKHYEHEARIIRNENDIYGMTQTIEKFKNNTYMYLLSILLQITIVVLQFVFVYVRMK